MTIRERLEQAIAGEPVTHPVYLAYDWFVDNRNIDWQMLFSLGMGRMNHVDILEFDRPNVEVVETDSVENGRMRKDITWVTDIGELHEYYLDGWRQEYMIKTPTDYRTLQHALSGVVMTPTDEHFDRSEAELGGNGITVGHLGWTPYESRRTSLLEIQVDFAGLERFSIDIITAKPELLDLIDLINEQTVEAFRCLLSTKARHIKLWENLSIETMGPAIYRNYVVPVYERIFDVLKGSDKLLQVHYDGNLKIIADDIAALRFDGIDSLTGPPEGDMTASEARSVWPDKFFWLHPNLGWFRLQEKELATKIRETVKAAGPSRFCLMLSEDVPPEWESAIPVVLKTLDDMALQSQ